MGKKIFLSIILAFNAMVVLSQLTDNRVNVLIGCRTGIFTGLEFVHDGSFIAPSLFSNQGNLTGISFKTVIKLNDYFSIGAGADQSGASGWSCTGSSLYDGSRLNLYSVFPVVQIHSGFRETGIMNRIRIFAEVAPSLGIAELKLGNSLFEILGEPGTVDPVMSSDPFYGIRVATGMELSVTRTFGVWFTGSFNKNLIKSVLSSDESFSYLDIGLGLVVRLANDKRFYY
ncbi:MAG: hypothetical protein MUE37_08690 [Bacteroidales bacterium]|jgi:hypothetical protein|nr:hypothetical protein [Bacteroidales bacterium]